MLLRKIDRFWRNGLIEISKSRIDLYIFLTIVLFGITGCSNISQKENQTIIEDGKKFIQNQNEYDKSDAVAETYREIYEDVLEINTLDSLGMTRNIVNRLGDMGYTAIDSENQIDMTVPDKVIRFCEKVDAEEEAELTIIVVSYLGGFTKYDFKTKSGNVDIVRDYYQYVNGHMEYRSTGTYRANTWEYTEEGYLLFEGYWFSGDYYMLTLSEVPDRAALRVKPLDEKCRELNRQYILPIGYGQNNMFLVDWSEDDYGELNFYDLYDIFYPFIYGQAVPYVMDNNLEVGAVYRIPKEEFEAVIMTYFNIDSKTLQSKTAYLSEDAAYEYKPRGFYEVEYPEIPYPEVVAYMENSDGTITLTVNVVYPDAVISKVYAHEVIIRPLNDGGVKYISNRIIPSEDNYEETWNAPRLTEEEWEMIYGNIE